MTTLATFNWMQARNGWRHCKVETEVCPVTLLRKGKRVAILLPGLCEYFGLAKNRLNVNTYKHKMEPLLTRISVGHGVGTYKNGEAQAVFSSNLTKALAAANVVPHPAKLAGMQALLRQAAQDESFDERPEAPGYSGWRQGDEAQHAWKQVLDYVRAQNLPLSRLLEHTSSARAHSRSHGRALVMVDSNYLSLISKPRRLKVLAKAYEAVLGVEPMNVVLYPTGSLIEEETSVVPQAVQEPIPFEEGEPQEDDVPADVLGVATDRDLLNAMGGVLAGVDKRLEELSEDLCAMEKNLNDALRMVARRNVMLSRIMTMMAEVLSSNLCTPDEHARGRWTGGKQDE